MTPLFTHSAQLHYLVSTLTKGFTAVITFRVYFNYVIKASFRLLMMLEFVQCILIYV